MYKERVMMREEIVNLSCPTCGIRFLSDESDSAGAGASISRCSNCAAVAELIAELIRGATAGSQHSYVKRLPLGQDKGPNVLQNFSALHIRC